MFTCNTKRKGKIERLLMKKLASLKLEQIRHIHALNKPPKKKCNRFQYINRMESICNTSALRKNSNTLHGRWTYWKTSKPEASTLSPGPLRKEQICTGWKIVHMKLVPFFVLFYFSGYSSKVWTHARDRTEPAEKWLMAFCTERIRNNICTCCSAFHPGSSVVKPNRSLFFIFMLVQFSAFYKIKQQETIWFMYTFSTESGGSFFVYGCAVCNEHSGKSNSANSGEEQKESFERRTRFVHFTISLTLSHKRGTDRLVPPHLGRVKSRKGRLSTPPPPPAASCQVPTFLFDSHRVFSVCVHVSDGGVFGGKSSLAC